MADKAYLAGAGAVWIQPDGPNSQPYYLGCHTLGDIEHPQGDATLTFVPNHEAQNDFIPLDIFRSGGPGPVSTSLQFVVRSVADWLEIIDCKVPIYVHQIGCGRKDVFDNWDRSVLLEDTVITSKSSSSFAVMSPEDQDRSMQSFDLNAKTLHRLFQLATGKQNIISVTGRTALSIAFSGSRRCYGSCGNVHTNYQDGYIGLVGVIGTPTNVYYTNDGGIIWQPTASNPFQSHEDVSGLLTVELSPTSYRVITARGVLDGLNPAEIAYSDDGGVSWTNIDVGSVNGQYAIGRGNPLFAWNSTRIWLVTTGGYIYYSDTAGSSWVAQESGIITTQNLHAIHFCSDKIGYAVGEANTVLRTLDGVTWMAITGPADELGNTAQAVFCLDRNHVWIGYDSGNLWYTNDGGVTWYKRDYPGSGTGQIQDIKFCNRYVGYIAHISTGGTTGSLFRTINGGWTWVTQSLPSGVGPLYDIHVANCNNIYTVGDF